jgi:hypothetical protein
MGKYDVFHSLAEIYWPDKNKDKLYNKLKTQWMICTNLSGVYCPFEEFIRDHGEPKFQGYFLNKCKKESEE